jgi:hypothetical protein
VVGVVPNVTEIREECILVFVIIENENANNKWTARRLDSQWLSFAPADVRSRFHAFGCHVPLKVGNHCGEI